MISSILVGYDGSDSSKNALEFAADLASRYGVELHVLAVARPPEFGDEVETRAVVEQSQHHLNKVLSDARSRLVANKARQHFHVVVGHPAEQIVRYAEEHVIDHIVVGRRGHTVFERWLIGSVARQVVAYAHCAVTVVRT
ncbi:MAG TPA: universal stress protein [Usitatibacter sp.]|nr:universal stress protein [Usitatibacter sp.]